MITPNRLQELIEQGATIYEAKYNRIEPIILADREVRFIHSDMLCLEPVVNERWLHRKYLNKLYETREEANWSLKMTAVREERLALPTWEEFLDKKFVHFYDKNHNICHLHYLHFSNEIYINVRGNVTVVGDLTKETYLEACELCLKLFKGD